MSEKTIYEGVKQEMRGLKDPGNALIAVYILLVFFLLLFAGLESARADLDKMRPGTFVAEAQGEQRLPTLKREIPSDSRRFSFPIER